MRTRTHGHLSEWAALVGAELPEELTGEAVGRAGRPERDPPDGRTE